MKKILFPLLLVALIPSTALAHEFKTPMEKPVVAQFDGIVINGKTVQQTLVDAEYESRQRSLDYLNHLKENCLRHTQEYKTLGEQERALAHVIYKFEVSSSSYNPHNATLENGQYIHYLPWPGLVEKCQHSNSAELQRHASLFGRRLAAYNALMDEVADVKARSDKHYLEVCHELGNKAIAPYAAQKEAEIEAEAYKKNQSIDWMRCSKCFTHCEYTFVYKNDLLELGCICGHLTSDHQIKYK